MQTRRKMSREGLELLKGFEGLRLTAARLPDGRWTMGHGHTQYAREGAVITAEDAEALLLYDLIPVQAAVNEAVQVEITQRQFDALACFAFNIGVEAFLASEVLARVNQERMTEAALAMAIWRSGAFGGKPVVLDALVRRRSAEGDMLLDAAPEPSPTPLVTPEVDPAAEAALPEQPPARLEIDLESPTARAELVEADVPPAPEAHTDSSAEKDAVVEVEAETAAPPVVTEASLSARVYASYPPEPFAPVATSEPAAPVAAAEPEIEDSIPLNVAPDLDAGIMAEAAEPPLVLILTPPPEVAAEGLTLDAEPEGVEPAPADHPGLFENPPELPADEALILAEPPAEFQGRVSRWGETAAYFGMGAVGLTAFGAGVAGFQMADTAEMAVGFNEKMVIGWVLVLIGVICVWIASYNLFKRLGGSED